MPGLEHGPSIKNPKVYNALRKKGMSKSKAAAISNAMADALDDLCDRAMPAEVREMPAAARAIFKAAFRQALNEETDQLASLLAMSAVKKKFTRVQNEEGDEEWVEKEEAKRLAEEEISEAIEALKAEGVFGGDDPEAEPGEGEAGEGEASEGEGGESEPGEGDEPAYSKTTKTTETTETRGGRRREVGEGGEGESGEGATDQGHAGDSVDVEMVDTLTLDSKSFRLTSDGYLVANPRVARTGIQLYKGYEVGRPDKEVVRVYRPETEVFSHAAMASLAHKPITLDHPPTSVDASNWKEHAVGKVEGHVARDGDYIRVPLMLMDAHAIAAAQSGQSQLSVGYKAKLKWGAGMTTDGQPFDAMQTGIQANHIALVSAARGGDKLRIGDRSCEDGGDAYFDREFSTAEREAAAKKGQAMPHGGFPVKSEKDLKNAIRAVGRAKNPAAAKAHIKKRASALGLTKHIPESWGDVEGDHGGQQRRSAMTERILDGVTIDLDDKDAQILDRHLASVSQKLRDQSADIDKLKTQVTELQGSLDTAKKSDSTKDGEIVALKAKLEDSKLTPDKLDKALNLRMEVVDRATTFFGDQKYPWQGKSDAQIRREVVAARLGDQKTKAMSDENVEGAFLSITEPEQQDGFTRMTRSFSGAPAGGNYSDAAAKAYDKRNADLSNRWRTKGKIGGAAV